MLSIASSTFLVAAVLGSWLGYLNSAAHPLSLKRSIAFRAASPPPPGSAPANITLSLVNSTSPTLFEPITPEDETQISIAPFDIAQLKPDLGPTLIYQHLWLGTQLWKTKEFSRINTATYRNPNGAIETVIVGNARKFPSPMTTHIALVAIGKTFDVIFRMVKAEDRVYPNPYWVVKFLGKEVGYFHSKLLNGGGKGGDDENSLNVTSVAASSLPLLETDPMTSETTVARRQYHEDKKKRDSNSSSSSNEPMEISVQLLDIIHPIDLKPLLQLYTSTARFLWTENPRAQIPVYIIGSNLDFLSPAHDLRIRLEVWRLEIADTPITWEMVMRGVLKVLAYTVLRGERVAATATMSWMGEDFARLRYERVRKGVGEVDLVVGSHTALV